MHPETLVYNVASQLSLFQRSEICSPSIYGAHIASIILSNKLLLAEWEENLQTMAGQIIKIREHLKQELDHLQTPGRWDHILNQIGIHVQLDWIV